MTSKEMPDILVVHLSDMHISTKNVTSVERLAVVPNAIGQCIERTSHVLILLTGDIAYSGKDDEYEIATVAIEKLAKDLSAWNPLSIRIYSCPGNHDCDFNLISGRIIDSLIKDIGNEYDDAIGVVKELVRSQKAYELFRDVVCNQLDHTNEVISTATFDYEGREICVCSINSSWSSRIKESPGSLRMPGIILPDLDLNSSLTICMTHHPINWYAPQDVRAFSAWLDRNVDIALWGHEHEEDDVERRRKSLGSSVRDFLAKPLEDKDSECGFSVISISGESEMMRKSDFTWDQDRFKLAKSGTPEAIPNNPGRILGRIRQTRHFIEFLDDPGGAFQHPRLTRNLRLSEIFIFTELRHLNEQTTSSTNFSSNTKSNDFAKKSLRAACSIVHGSEQSGKTTLAKFLISEANRSGFIPIYLDASSLKSANLSEITGWINSCIKYQYEKDCIDLVMQKKPSERVVILDNYHLVPAGSTGASKVMERIKSISDKVILFTAEPFAASLLSTEGDSFRDHSLLADSEKYEIIPLNHRQRGELIRRWISIDQDISSSKEQIEREARQTKKFIDLALGKDSIPKYPIFILILLQHVEIGREISTAITNGSHGYLFEALITKSLDAHAKSHPINTTHTYLAKLANEIWKSETNYLDQAEFSDFHDNCAKNSLVMINKDLLLRDLDRARVISNDARGVSFRYSYLYYYYYARWITSENCKNSEEILDNLVQHIHTEKAANVLMFVAYREKENDVLSKLIPLAKSLYSDTEPSSLDSHSELLIRFRTAQEKNILLLGSPDEVSDQQNQRDDEIEKIQSDDAREIKDRLNINTALKTIQVLGHVMKSRASEIENEKLIEISEETISLSIRMMSFLGNFIREEAELITHYFSDIFEKALKIGRDESIKYANQLIGMLVIATSRMCLGRAANAISSYELIPLLKIMEQKLEEQDENLVILLARIAAENEYPENQVNRFLTRIKDSDVLSRNLLAWSVSRRFYLNPPPHGLRDSACKRLGIEQKNIQARVQKIPGPKQRY